MKRALTKILFLISIFFAACLSSCRTTKQAQETVAIPEPEKAEKTDEPKPNIHVEVNIDSAIAATPQDVFLYTSYDCNYHLLDSIHTDGSTKLVFNGFIPFQNKVELTFEKRGARKIRLILSPGDSISFDAPEESEIAFENEVEIPHLSAQTEWNAHSRQNSLLRNRADSLISLLVHTPKTDTLRLKELKKKYDADSIAIHKMYTTMVNSSSPYMVSFSLIFLNISYQEDYLYKDTLLRKFPDYLPIKLHYHLVPDAKETAESKRLRAKINRILNERASIIHFSETGKTVKTGIGKKLKLDLHKMNGDKQSLDVFDGKYVLVDFWASWCRPCVENMRTLIDVQKKYASDFEVCAITIDKLPGAWKRRIESVGMQNFHHFVGVDFSTGKLYPDVEGLGLKEIPQNFLLDRKGRIVAINIFGEKLTQKLEKLTKP